MRQLRKNNIYLRHKAEDGQKVRTKEVDDDDYNTYFGKYLDGVTVTPSGNRDTTRDDWYNANYQQLVQDDKQKELQQMYDFQNNIRKATNQFAPYVAGGAAVAALPALLPAVSSAANFMQYPFTTMFGNNEYALGIDGGIQATYAAGALADMIKSIKKGKLKPADNVGQAIKNYSNVALDALAVYPLAKTTNALRKTAAYPFKSYKGRAIADAFLRPEETISALYNGKYVKNKSDLFRLIRQAYADASEGADFTRRFYNHYIGVNSHAPRIRFYNAYKSPSAKGYFRGLEPNTINVMPYKHSGSNIIDTKNSIKSTAAHENTHRLEHYINEYEDNVAADLVNHNYELENMLNAELTNDACKVLDYAIPTQHFGDRYFVPNDKHPIVKRYLKYFKKGSTHGKAPEEHLADFVGNRSISGSWHDIKNEIINTEGTSVPLSFYDEYYNYLNNAIKETKALRAKYIK